MKATKGQFDIDELVNHEWRHWFSDDEKSEMKERSIQLNNEVDSLKKDLKEHNARENKKIKEKVDEDKVTRFDLKAGYVDKTEKVKVIENLALERVEFWSQETGDMVDERPMSKKELRKGFYINN